MQTQPGLSRTAGLELVAATLDEVLVAIAREAARSDIDVTAISFHCEPWTWYDVEVDEAADFAVGHDGYRLTITSPLKG